MPRTWNEFIGKGNLPAIKRLQEYAIRGHRPPPYLLIGPYGSAKTALAEFTIKSHACANPSLVGDPCHTCGECRLVLPAQNGLGSMYRRYLVDCHHARLTRENLMGLLKDIEQEDDVAVFFDELHGLDRTSLNLLLTVIPKFSGILIAAIMDSEYRNLPPELFERFRKIWLRFPTVDELVAFFCHKAECQGVQTDACIVRLMVEATGQSFRTCLDLIHAAAEDSPRVLDRALLDEFLGPDVRSKTTY